MNDVLSRARALQHLVDRPEQETPPQPLAEAVVTCSRDLVEAGEPRLALALIDSSDHMSTAAGPDWIMRIQVVRTRAILMDGDYGQSIALAQRLRAGHRHPSDAFCAECCELSICEGSGLWCLNRADEAVAMLLRVRAELLRLPDSALLARCAVQLSAAETVRGELKSARAFALEAVVSGRRSGNNYAESTALNNYGRLERSLCRWAEAEEAAVDALAMLERGGSRVQANSARRSLAIIFWKCGRLDESLALAETCSAEGAALGHGMLEWLGCLLKGMVLLHKGEHDNARRLFTRMKSWDVPRAESRASLLTAEFLGDIDLDQGHAEPALKQYNEVWPKSLALVPRGDIVAELRRRRAECYYLLGRWGEAYSEAQTGLQHCRELGDRYEEAATYRVLALAAAAAGNPAEARRWFDQGFSSYDDIETPYEWGKLWMSYGDWLCGMHAGEYADPRGALEAYHAAGEHFERIGALARLGEARARVAAMTATRDERASSTAATAAADSVRPPRRPRGSAELDRRSEWARATFGFITRNKRVLDLLTDVGKLANAGSPMLILGESGTGKELIAQGVHRLSGRAGTFIPINCAALPREVIESELFGHVAGAFTGASRDKAGLLEVCDHGTVFLDEIAEMSIELQSRLLRFLETGEMRRVGANRNLKVDTLVVAATNRERASLEGGEGFRPDLYYRLAHAVVGLPPLRRRGEDIELLVGHFFDESCRAHQKQVTLSDGARNRLVAYPWPGNIRQLRAVMRRLVILAPPDHLIAADDVHLDHSDVASTLTEELEQAERRRMVEALAQSSGSRSEAARSLGMARTTLVTKMKRYGIQ